MFAVRSILQFHVVWTLALAIVWLTTGRTTSAAEIPAFPGAMGFGATTPGGRGGKVLFVTNTNDSGAGSLRAACEAEGPRTVLFRTGGTIELESDILISNPYITIAGQTAPGGGICLKNAARNKRASLMISTHDVVVRFVRVRPGIANRPSCCLRGIAVVKGAHHVVVDHCSLSWSVDELFTVWEGVHDVTLQWCILAEALHRANHKEGRPHSCGALLGNQTSRDFTLHHNLFAHNDQRNPRIKCGGVVDVVNNVVYNFGGTPGSNWGASHISHGARANYVRNYVKPGPDSIGGDYWVSAEGVAEFFVKDNVTPTHAADDDSQWKGVVRPKDRSRIVNRPFKVPTVTATSAAEAFKGVLESAGASSRLSADNNVWTMSRDAVDRRIVRDVQAGRGKIIDSPKDVGGWPLLAAGRPPTDSDNDGMPNEWEKIHQLDPENADDGRQDPDGDGYTNLEEYLNGSKPRNR